MTIDEYYYRATQKIPLNSDPFRGERAIKLEYKYLNQIKEIDEESRISKSSHFYGKYIP